MNEVVRLLADGAGLTRRESDILLLLARGYRPREIEEKLAISGSTVHSHTSSIYAKLNIHSHDELVKLVRETRAAIEDK